MADQAVAITNCYTVGKITVDGGSGNLFSAFGKASGTAVITGCYALDNGDAFAGGSTSGITGGGLLSEAQMKNPASYSGWDFVTVWQAGPTPRSVKTNDGFQDAGALFQAPAF